MNKNLKEDGHWKTIGDYPGHMTKGFKKKKRKEGDMSFIRDTDSKKKFKERMHLKLGKV